MAVLAILLLLGVVVLPQIWVRYTMSRHGADRPELPGTGAEFARHLAERLGLSDLRVERTELPDHYDPDADVVRLSAAHHDGRSIAAVAVAAHEVGHALQRANGERMLAWRQKLARVVAVTDRIAGIFFIAAPLFGILARTPLVFAGLMAVGVALLSVRVVVNLVTLPVEFDASFGKALPLIEEGGYLEKDDMPAVRSVLRAAAFTYVAGALMSLINLARWARLLR